MFEVKLLHKCEQGNQLDAEVLYGDREFERDSFVGHGGEEKDGGTMVVGALGTQGVADVPVVKLQHLLRVKTLPVEKKL